MEESLEGQKALIASHEAEILRLKDAAKKCTKGYKAAKKRIAELEHGIDEVTETYEDLLDKQSHYIQAMEDQLTRAGELLAAMSVDFTGPQSFLSTTNRLSETEVLGIVHDLNENTFQVAATLGEEWEELGSSSSSSGFMINEEDVDTFSRSYGSALVSRALKRDPVAVTLLVQSCLCGLVAHISSSWRHNAGIGELRKSVCRKFSDSEGQVLSAQLRTLARSYLSAGSSHSASIMRHIADVLWVTGSFPSTQDSFNFVKEKVSDGVETVEKLTLRLVSMFIADVTSSDMCLLFETPGTMYDGARVTKEFEPDQASATGERCRVVGTAGVGIEKSVFDEQNESRSTVVLLKARVVLEDDLAFL